MIMVMIMIMMRMRMMAVPLFDNKMPLQCNGDVNDGDYNDDNSKRSLGL